MCFFQSLCHAAGQYGNWRPCIGHQILHPPSANTDSNLQPRIWIIFEMSTTNHHCNAHWFFAKFKLRCLMTWEFVALLLLWKLISPSFSQEREIPGFQALWNISNNQENGHLYVPEQFWGCSSHGVVTWFKRKKLGPEELIFTSCTPMGSSIQWHLLRYSLLLVLSFCKLSDQEGLVLPERYGWRDCNCVGSLHSRNNCDISFFSLL